MNDRYYVAISALADALQKLEGLNASDRVVAGIIHDVSFAKGMLGLIRDSVERGNASLSNIKGSLQPSASNIEKLVHTVENSDEWHRTNELRLAKVVSVVVTTLVLVARQ